MKTLHELFDAIGKDVITKDDFTAIQFADRASDDFDDATGINIKYNREYYGNALEVDSTVEPMLRMASLAKQNFTGKLVRNGDLITVEL